MKINFSLTANGKVRAFMKVGAALLVVALLSLASYFGYRAFTAPEWPDFVAAGEAAAQTATGGSLPLIARVDERDYGYRTGDIVNVHLFVKQEKGIVVDTQAVTVQGDFEMAEKPSVASKKLANGSMVYRLDLRLQSFKVAPKVVLAGTISAKRAESNTRFDTALPSTEVFTSNTYDGRPNLMEGQDPRIAAWWYYSRHIVPLLIAGIIFLLVLRQAIKAHLIARIKPVLIDHARLRALALVSAIKDGSAGKAEHLELDGLIRDKFKIGPVPAEHLDITRLPTAVHDFLKLNEPAIYSQDNLDDDGRSTLANTAALMMKSWK